MSKKVTYLLLLPLLCFCCQNYGTQTTPLTATSSSTIDLKHKRILFLGNSITHNGLYVSLIKYALQKSNPANTFDIISIGLGSETVSQLSEPRHPFPRPALQERLNRALEATKPDMVIATYGINDGIYHPPNSERLAAYQEGIQTLIQKTKDVKAELILITPTPFDALPINHKLSDIDASEFWYGRPYRGYDDVLTEYTDWLNSLNGKDLKVIDWHTPINAQIATKRKLDPTFSYAQDGIHPNNEGHLLMAKLFLKALNLNNVATYLTDYPSIVKDAIFQEVHQQRIAQSERWLNYIGYSRGKTVKSIHPKSLLIMMGGQSNMTGLAKKEQLDNTSLPKHIDFIDYSFTSELKMQKDRFGPEYGLSKSLNQTFPHQHFTLLKYAVGGASLLDWAPNYSSEKAAITGNPQFGNLFEAFLGKIDSLIDKGETLPTAFLWMQGERDARIPEAGKDYYSNFKNFIQAIRQRTGQSDLPFIFGMVNPPAERYAALESVRNAQRKIATELPNVFIIETDDLEKLTDKLHYNTAGQLEMGKRFGEKLHPLLKELQLAH